jgi:hypothetical protein
VCVCVGGIHKYKHAAAYARMLAYARMRVAAHASVCTHAVAYARMLAHAVQLTSARVAAIHRHTPRRRCARSGAAQAQ